MIATGEAPGSGSEAGADPAEIRCLAAIGQGLLAKRAGCKRTLAVVHRPDYMEIYRHLGIDIVLSPRVVASDHILRFTRSNTLKSLTVLEEGQAEVLEIEVQPGSRLVGKELKDAGFPRGCVVGAITREAGEVLIPKGDDEIRPGDQLVLFVLNRVIDEVMHLAGIVRE